MHIGNCGGAAWACVGSGGFRQFRIFRGKKRGYDADFGAGAEGCGEKMRGIGGRYRGLGAV